MKIKKLSPFFISQSIIKAVFTKNMLFTVVVYLICKYSKNSIIESVEGSIYGDKYAVAHLFNKSIKLWLTQLTNLF